MKQQANGQLETRQLIFGLDIGVASCGWAVVDKETGKIIESGANLFDCADASRNAERRQLRELRRQIRRRKTRIADFQKLWHASGFTTPDEQTDFPLKSRVIGLDNKISLNDLYWILLSMLKHRGISYLEETDEESTEGKDYSAGLVLNQKELKNAYPCEIQWKRYLEYGSYRGQRIVSSETDNELSLINVFTTGSYRKELLRLFATQRQYYNEIDETFQEKYLQIFDRKREYYIGPGNEKSRTDYGVYTTEQLEDGTFRTDENLFSRLIGKCSVYPEELRAAAASFTAQEFNVLNDLNNITVNGRKLEEEEKRSIVKTLLQAKNVVMRAVIKKAIGEEIETFEGARIDKNDKEQFHSFEIYRKMRNHLASLGIDIEVLSREMLDDIGYILTLNTERDGIMGELEKLGLDESIKEALLKFRFKNGSLFTKWHAFSLKIMNEIIPVMYEQPKEQQTILTEMGVFRHGCERFKDHSSIPFSELSSQLYNPVVVRSARITIRVMNALLKKYGMPGKIVVEMPRDKNSDEEQDRIKKQQKRNESELEEVKKRIRDEYGIEITDEDFRNHKGLVLKLKLWNEQDGICLYSGERIPIEELIHNQEKFEVDHIIPLSVSFDDSRSNKTLCFATENQDKRVRTPYGYLREVTRNYGWKQFEATVLDLKRRKRIDDIKLKNYLFTQDIMKIDVLKGFINRNLNDTRYASRLVLNTLQDFFNAQETGTVVTVVRGKFTDMMRKNLALKKDRDESFSHHAIDAMLLCYSQMGYDAFRKLQGEFIDFETGELLDEVKWDEEMTEKKFQHQFYGLRWSEYRKNITEAEKNVKYWHKVDHKCNRGLCNQTIYGTREIAGRVMKVSKTEDIRTKAGYEKLKKLVEDGKEENVLMSRNDPITWDNIKRIMKEYSSVTEDGKEKPVNPFVLYEKETRDVVRKYAKKHNGPKVTKIAYIDGEVNSCIDISHKYGLERGSRKVILDSLNPYRMDVYFNQQNKLYYLVGIKYSDIKTTKKGFVIDKELYEKALRREKVLLDNQRMDDLETLGIEFVYSFFKNDIIEYEKDENVYRERFLSRTMPAKRNYIETKPIEASSFSKQHSVGLSKTKSIRKIRSDILGNAYYAGKEKFSMSCE